jgi:hypothetical protein
MITEHVLSMHISRIIKYDMLTLTFHFGNAKKYVKSCFDKRYEAYDRTHAWIKKIIHRYEGVTTFHQQIVDMQKYAYIYEFIINSMQNVKTINIPNIVSVSFFHPSNPGCEYCKHMQNNNYCIQMEKIISPYKKNCAIFSQKRLFTT